MAPRPNRIWSVDAAMQVMIEQELLADMFPSFNVESRQWEICLSDERGNGIEYIAFATEEEADTFCEALDLALADRNAASS